MKLSSSVRGLISRILQGFSSKFNSQVEQYRDKEVRERERGDGLGGHTRQTLGEKARNTWRSIANNKREQAKSSWEQVKQIARTN